MKKDQPEQNQPQRSMQSIYHTRRTAAHSHSKNETDFFFFSFRRHSETLSFQCAILLKGPGHEVQVFLYAIKGKAGRNHQG
jgi:hypothetical protein